MKIISKKIKIIFSSSKNNHSYDKSSDDEAIKLIQREKEKNKEYLEEIRKLKSNINNFA